MIRNTYSKDQQDIIVKRLLKYAGATMDSRLNYPNITKREAIMLADAFKELQAENKKLQECLSYPDKFTDYVTNKIHSLLKNISVSNGGY